MNAPTAFPHILVVQASAGAGKTYSLALRFLQLLAIVGPPSPIALRRLLALTFTVAAAQEMKSRIVSFLKDIALQTPQGKILQGQSGLEPKSAEAWLDCILQHFHAFQVKTIDSLHFQLVQALGRRMNLWPELEASFDQGRWARLMLESLLAKTAWEEAPALGADFASTGTLRSLWEEIFSIYLHLEVRTGVRFLSWLEDQATHVFTGLDQLLSPLQTTSIANLTARQKEYENLCQEFSQTLEHHDLAGHISRFKPLEILADPLGKIDSAFFTKDTLEQLFKKQVHAATSRPELPLVWAMYAAVCQTRNAFLLEKARLRVDPLARLQQLLIRELERLGQSQGLLLGGWWTRLIRQHLGGEDLLQEAEIILGAKWRHMLIDEFQDTSREQWEVLRELALEALAQGGSLFCVGDVKQAIYGWRGGDWRLFFEPLSPKTFPNVEAQARQQMALPFNRRSCPEIVEWNNACFASLENPEKSTLLAATMISAKDKDQARSLLASAILSLYSQGCQSPFKQCVGKVRLTTLKAETVEEYKALAMHALTEEILVRKNNAEPLRDIAVLVRTNLEAGDCAKALLGKGIPTIAEQSLMIAGHPHVRGLLALLAWLDNPSDNAALYALCHSPLLGPANSGSAGGSTALAEALAVIYASGDASSAPPLYLLLRQAAPDIWARHFQPFWEHGGFASAYEVLLAATTHFQLRALPLGEWAWIEKLLEAAWSAETEGAATIAGFLDFWREKGSECVVGLPEGLEAVRVLTIHKAKGLEFPQVILPLLGYGPKNRSGYHLLYAPGGEPFLASTAKPRSKEVAAVADQETQKTMAEELNLLYVALTRARQGLHLFLADVKNAKGSLASDWLRAIMPEELADCGS